MAPVAESNGSPLADGRQHDRMANYTKRWNNDDLSKDSGVDDRNDSYTDVVNGKYYHSFPSVSRLNVP